MSTEDREIQKALEVGIVDALKREYKGISERLIIKHKAEFESECLKATAGVMSTVIERDMDFTRMGMDLRITLRNQFNSGGKQ